MMKNRHGFTLLEMAVVMAIIAFIIAGIVGGKTLIHQSEIRSIYEEYGQYTQAVKEFQDKYQQLPGDFSTAETLWGTDDDSGTNACPNNTYTATAPTSSATCNGNGTGTIGLCTNNFSRTECTTTYVNEIWRVWQHLSNAGLIEGRYTGRRGGSVSSTQATPGLNVPASKFKPAGWTLVFYTNLADAAWLKRDHYGHIFLFGGGKGAEGGAFTTEPVVPLSDAYAMDIKLDDGIPTSGMLRAWDDYWLPTSDNGPTAGAADSSYCVNSTAYFEPDGSYSERQYSCSLIFIPGF